MAEPTIVTLGERQLKVTNLDKVLYPDAGMTKAEIIQYYVAIAPVMLPHLEARPVTFVRYPDGVDAKSFFEKNCPSHRPDWVDTVHGPGDIQYCRLDEPASLAWTANLAALELHTPMWRADAPESPTMVVFDLDPGPGVGIQGCARTALKVRDVLDAVGLVGFAKTSGSKGMQLYVPLNKPHAHDHAKSFALAVGQLLERDKTNNVVTTMAKSERKGKVFIDWSQNVKAKTTVCVYSLRARSRPTVSTPVTWDEVSSAAGGEPLSFEASEVVERVDRLGDLFGAVLSLEQALPVAGG